MSTANSKFFYIFISTDVFEGYVNIRKIPLIKDEQAVCNRNHI